MQWKAQIMDEAQLQRSVTRITHQIIEHNHGADRLCLLGIKRRGIPLAEMIAQRIREFEGIDVPVGHVDIALYRDDLTELASQPGTSGCFIPCDVAPRTIILVDDVLFTGRTVRAAIEAVIRHGRPRAIQLAVLIDRGHRELPIRPDYVGKNIPTSRAEVVLVRVESVDGCCGVDLYQLP